MITAEEGSISRAATRLHMSQPPLSVRLQGLERELGVQLLVRHGRGVETTAAGRVLAERGRRLLADLDATADEVRAIGRGEHGRLRVAVGHAVPPPLVTRLIAAVGVDTPGVAVELVETEDNHALESIRDGEVDAALAPLPPSPKPRATAARGTESAVVTREPLVAVLPAEPEAGTERTDLRSFDSALITLSHLHSPAMHAHTLGAWQAATGSRPTVHEAGSITGILTLILAGVGISLLPAGFEKTLWSGLTARPLLHHTPVVETAVHWGVDANAPILARFLRTALATPEPDVLELHHARTQPWVDDRC